MPITVMRDGPEAIEDAIASTLRANVNAYLDAVWTAWGAAAGVPKVYPAQVVSGRRALQPQFPAYIVRSLDGHTEEDLAPRYGYMAHRFEIVVMCQSSDDHVLDIQVKRHLTAIRKTLGNVGCHCSHQRKSDETPPNPIPKALNYRALAVWVDSGHLSILRRGGV